MALQMSTSNPRRYARPLLPKVFALPVVVLARMARRTGAVQMLLRPHQKSLRPQSLGISCDERSTAARREGVFCRLSNRRCIVKWNHIKQVPKAILAAKSAIAMHNICEQRRLQWEESRDAPPPPSAAEAARRTAAEAARAEATAPVRVRAAKRPCIDPNLRLEKARAEAVRAALKRYAIANRSRQYSYIACLRLCIP